MLKLQATDINRYKSTTLCANVVVVVVVVVVLVLVLATMWTYTFDV
jgi:hypothetical protein